MALEVGVWSDIRGFMLCWCNERDGVLGMGVAAGNELGSLACAGYECNVDKLRPPLGYTNIQELFKNISLSWLLENAKPARGLKMDQCLVIAGGNLDQLLLWTECTVTVCVKSTKLWDGNMVEWNRVIELTSHNSVCTGQFVCMQSN